MNHGFGHELIVIRLINRKLFQQRQTDDYNNASAYYVNRWTFYDNRVQIVPMMCVHYPRRICIYTKNWQFAQNLYYTVTTN